MDDYQSLNHTQWECKYHVVFIPKCRRKVLYKSLRQHLGEVFKQLAEQRESRIEQGHLQADHVHMMISIPPKYAVSDVIGRLKGRSASLLRKQFQWLERVYWKENIVWSPGYFVSTVGVDEEQILRYVKYQQDQDSGQAKLDL